MTNQSHNADSARNQMISRMLLPKPTPAPRVNRSSSITEAFLQSQRQYGLKTLCRNPQYESAVNARVEVIWKIFWEQLEQKPLVGLYLFDPALQGEGYQGFSGITTPFEYAHKTVYFVGLSSELFEGPEEQQYFVILHEFAHVLAWSDQGHEPHWHAFLNTMLVEFNRQTGMCIMNDYNQFNDDPDDYHAPDTRE